MAKQRLVWKRKPESEDYDGARRYMSLLYSDAEAAKLLRALREAKTSEYPAKDLLRAPTRAINFRSTYRFPVDRYADQLLATGA